jgi:hypothetical protein
VGYLALSRQFGITVSMVAKVCRYERRAQWPARFKRIG